MTHVFRHCGHRLEPAVGKGGRYRLFFLGVFVVSLGTDRFVGLGSAGLWRCGLWGWVSRKPVGRWEVVTAWAWGLSGGSHRIGLVGDGSGHFFPWLRGWRPAGLKGRTPKPIFSLTKRTTERGEREGVLWFLGTGALPGEMRATWPSDLSLGMVNDSVFRQRVWQWWVELCCLRLFIVQICVLVLVPCLVFSVFVVFSCWFLFFFCGWVCPSGRSNPSSCDLLLYLLSWSFLIICCFSGIFPSGRSNPARRLCLCSLLFMTLLISCARCILHYEEIRQTCFAIWRVHSQMQIVPLYWEDVAAQRLFRAAELRPLSMTASACQQLRFVVDFLSLKGFVPNLCQGAFASRVVLLRPALDKSWTLGKSWSDLYFPLYSRLLN